MTGDVIVTQGRMLTLLESEISRRKQAFSPQAAPLPLFIFDIENALLSQKLQCQELLNNAIVMTFTFSLGGVDVIISSMAQWQLISNYELEHTISASGTTHVAA